MSDYPGGAAGADTIRADYDVNGNVTYFGLSHPMAQTSDPLWQIRLLTYDGNGNLINWLWASGDRKFDKVWDNRGGYAYS
jgi:YD repeat-containing protein